MNAKLRCPVDKPVPRLTFYFIWALSCQKKFKVADWTGNKTNVPEGGVWGALTPAAPPPACTAIGKHMRQLKQLTQVQGQLSIVVPDY